MRRASRLTHERWSAASASSPRCLIASSAGGYATSSLAGTPSRPSRLPSRRARERSHHRRSGPKEWFTGASLPRDRPSRRGGEEGTTSRCGTTVGRGSDTTSPAPERVFGPRLQRTLLNVDAEHDGTIEELPPVHRDGDRARHRGRRMRRQRHSRSCEGVERCGDSDLRAARGIGHADGHPRGPRPVARAARAARAPTPPSRAWSTGTRSRCGSAGGRSTSG